MSQVHLVTVEGYGPQGIPRVEGSEEIAPVAVVPDTRDIMAVIRTDFDVEPDGSRRSNPAIDPVIRSERVNELVGRLLTLVDASTSNANQAKAQKTLVKTAVWDWYEAQSAALRSLPATFHAEDADKLAKMVGRINDRAKACAHQGAYLR